MVVSVARVRPKARAMTLTKGEMAMARKLMRVMRVVRVVRAMREVMRRVMKVMRVVRATREVSREVFREVMRVVRMLRVVRVMATKMMRVWTWRVKGRRWMTKVWLARVRKIKEMVMKLMNMKMRLSVLCTQPHLRLPAPCTHAHPLFLMRNPGVLHVQLEGFSMARLLGIPLT